ncbi:MAG: hypothetical protein AAGA77_12780 [Bacteroidota bacterium]
MLIREKFHKIIDEIDDEQKLQGFYNLISRLSNSENGALYKALTKAQKEELDIAYEESFDKKNLIDHDEIKSKYAKWL